MTFAESIGTPFRNAQNGKAVYQMIIQRGNTNQPVTQVTSELGTCSLSQMSGWMSEYVNEKWFTARAFNVGLVSEPALQQKEDGGTNRSSDLHFAHTFLEIVAQYNWDFRKAELQRAKLQ